VYSIARPCAPLPRGLLSDAPLPLLVALGVLTAGAGVLAACEIMPLAPARALGAGGAQGALLAAAVAWAAAPTAGGRSAAAMAALTVLAGALAAALAPFGELAYLAAPLWLWRARTRLPGLGLARAPIGLVAAGAAFGAVLGVHLLVTASLTLGYGVRTPTMDLAPWLAAAALVTAGCLARYLVDPLLPHSVEVTAGAIFYLTLLSLGNCWLYWRSGSILPGAAGSVVFFAAYRLLHEVP
jgi:hypothetical protein